MEVLHVLFLDIDGVLNNHKMMDNGWCGIDYDKVLILNRFLRSHKHVKVVISSAWRYMIAPEAMTLKGFEYMLIACGLDVEKRVIGQTVRDEEFTEAHGKGVREQQIMRNVNLFKPYKWAVLDDLDLDLPEEHFVRTDGNTGVTLENVLQLKAIFKKKII